MAGATNRNFELVTPGCLVKCWEDDDVILSCQLSPETSAEAMEIRWFTGTLCIYLFKDGHAMARRGYERMSVDPEKLQRGDVSLTLKKSIEGNIGVYTCQVISGECKKEGRLGLLVQRASLQPALSYILDHLDERGDEITAEERKKMEESVQSLALALQKKVREQPKETQRRNTKHTEESSKGINGRLSEERRDRQREENSTQPADRVKDLAKDVSKLANKRELQTDKHFIDIHCIALIENVSMVDPILDRLLQWGVLSREACADVRSQNTSQKQMRSLLNQSSIRTPKGKDMLFNALMDTEAFLMEQLLPNE